MISKGVFIGVDPGNSGAIAFYRPKTEDLRVWDMPLRVKGQSKYEIDVDELCRLIDAFVPTTVAACVERVAALNINNRRQGGSSMFTFGASYGSVLGVLAGVRIQTHTVVPAVWKGIMGLSQDKNLSRSMAMTKFPRFAESFARKKDDGKAEAALLAHFCSVRFG